jgi:hypothetical protein
MSIGSSTARVYQDLADWYERQSQAQMRDRFLLLAADAVLSAGQPEVAERLRLRLLEHSPHHMLKPFASFAEAMHSPDVQGYINDLRQTYPLETAEELLRSFQGSTAPTSDRSHDAPAPPPEDEERPKEDPLPPEPLKVYRVKDEAEPTALPPRPQVAPRGGAAPLKKVAAPAIPARAARPVSQPVVPPPPRSAPPITQPPVRMAPLVAPPSAPVDPPPAVRPVAPVSLPVQHNFVPGRPDLAPRSPLRPKPREEDDPAEHGGWVASGLFGIVLLVSLALLVYTFGRPFVPPQWLP